MSSRTSNKHALIDKANSTVTITVAVAAFVVFFSLASSWSLFSQRNFQARVIDHKEKAVSQLEENKKAVDEIDKSYQEFIAQDPNALGGSIKGEGEKDGDNAKIVLDALPSKYDFPALIASVEKLLQDSNFPIIEVSGSDDEVQQKGENQAVELTEVPFQFKTVGQDSAVFDLLAKLEGSIRPLSASAVVFTFTDEGLEVDYSGTTYFLPETTLKIEEKVVR